MVLLKGLLLSPMTPSDALIPASCMTAGAWRVGGVPGVWWCGVPVEQCRVPLEQCRVLLEPGTPRAGYI